MNKLLRVLGVVAPVLGVILLLAVAGSTNSARWGGYLEALPLVGLLVLFVIGHGLVHALLPRRRVAR